MKVLKALCLAMAVAAPSMAAAAPAGGLFSEIAVTSDNRYQGVSNSDGHAAIWANLHYWRPDGWYAGLSAYQVDFDDPGQTSYELDGYAGRNIALDHGRTELKVEGMYTSYPDNRTPGPTYDFFQAKLAAKHVQGPLTLIATTSFVPQASYGSGQAWRLEGQADYAVTPALSVSAQFGRRWIGKGADRNYWDLGVRTRWKTLGFALDYVGTDLNRRRCGPYNPGICGPALVGTLTAALPPLLF